MDPRSILRCSPSHAVASTVTALREMRCKDRIPRGSQYQPSRPPLRHWTSITSLGFNYLYRLIAAAALAAGRLWSLVLWPAAVAAVVALRSLRFRTERRSQSWSGRRRKCWRRKRRPVVAALSSLLFKRGSYDRYLYYQDPV